MDEKQFAVIAHLSGFLGFVIPFGNILGPLLIWLMKKDESKVIGAHALEALNFQITASIAMVLAGFSMVILIGVVLLPVVVIGTIALMVMAAMAANKGESYKYPFTLRLIS